VLDLLETQGGVEVVQFGNRTRIRKGDVIRNIELTPFLNTRFIVRIADLYGVPTYFLFGLPRVYV